MLSTLVGIDRRPAASPPLARRTLVSTTTTAARTVSTMVASNGVTIRACPIRDRNVTCGGPTRVVAFLRQAAARGSAGVSDPALGEVVVDHSGGLHESVRGGRADEAEPSSLELL